MELKGLSKDAVKANREKYGNNLITPPQKEPLWKLFLEKFEDPVIRVLLIAAFLSLGIAFIEKEFAETIGIFCAILLATGVAFYFEYDAQKKFDMLGTIDDDTMYKVIRDGVLHEIPKRDIVVGDIVVLETGEEIPADGRIVESISLSINESNLTGEPIISKSAKDEDFDKEATYPTYMLMRGTTVVEGHATMSVTAVGDNTEYGKVARQSTIASTEKTPLNIQLESLAKFIGVAGFGLAFLTFIILFVKDIFYSGDLYSFEQIYFLGVSLIALMVMLVKVWMPIIYDGFEIAGKSKKLPKYITSWGWFMWIIIGAMVMAIVCAVSYLVFGLNPMDGASWISIAQADDILKYFMVAVTLIVVSVPEGLPMSITLSLALSMRRMLKANNLVRKMHACETMGAATVICTDKTGTLTQNRMSVNDVQFYGLNDNKLSDNNLSKIIEQGISVNSTAFLDTDDNGVTKAIGNPTEGALLLWLNKNNIDFKPLRDSAVIIDQLTFSTERKFMATLIEGVDSNILYMKGAPEIVLSKCKSIIISEREQATEEYRSLVESKLLEYQNRAMRTLGFAYCEVDKSIKNCEEAIAAQSPKFLGIAAIADPVREDVPDAIARCLAAGIAIKIVTGDTPATAKEIARQIGLWGDTDSDINHITGVEFEAMSDEELLQRVGKLKIMSRARPTDKQRLVQLLQQTGEVVAVTGDGTNDAPALNFAHIGLSMGTGTSVAKEASDITLLDDSFNSIATAVMWGRSLYRNIQRFIVFQLTINLTALVVVFFGSIFGAELPLTVTQMLWVNLIMDTFAAGALASLPPDVAVMGDKPRASSAFIITRPMSRNIISVGVTFIAALMAMLLFFGKNISTYDLSVFFSVFVLLQFWNMFNAKAFGSNKSAFSEINKCGAFLFVLLLILVGQILIVTYAGAIFRTEPIALIDWIKIIASTSIVLWIGELTRLISRLRAK